MQLKNLLASLFTKSATGNHDALIEFLHAATAPLIKNPHLLEAVEKGEEAAVRLFEYIEEPKISASNNGEAGTGTV